MKLMRAMLRLLHRLCLGTASRLRNLYYRALGVRFKGYVWLRAVSIRRDWAGITLERGVALDRGVVLLCGGQSKPDTLVIREGTYINCYTIVDAHLRVEVGRNCMIGPLCYITDSNHGTAPHQRVNQQPMVSAPVIIEDEVWLGAGVTVLSGVRIGKGAIVGAGSVVTRDVLPNAIVVGVPAAFLKYRV